MRVLVLHNRYAYRGGEDVVVEAEAALLRRHGHEVRLLVRDNRSIRGGNWLRVAWDLSWNPGAYADVRDELGRQPFDVVHVHNFFPQLSPSVFAACRAAGVPVVHTLHNYRLLCAAAVLARGDGPCEKCAVGSPYWAVRHACYRGSRLASLPAARMLDVHRRRATWSTLVDRYIAPSASVRARFVQAGFPPERIVVKPHFVAGDDAPARDTGEADEPRQGALFVGRLSPEKGVPTFLAAWQDAGLPPLTVVGEGPLADDVRDRQDGASLRYLGWQAPAAVAALMRQARLLIVPSRLPETFGLVLIEAFRCGLPVIASRIGAIPDLVQDGVTGLLVRPGDAADLAAKVRWANAHPEELRRMGERAAAAYRRQFTPEQNLAQLEAIYGAVALRRGPAAPEPS